MTFSRLSVTGLSKSFGATTALDDVSFDVVAGRVHALVGENGAGKSTLLKIISGIYTPDRGSVEMDGEPLHSGSPLGAQQAGIQIVHQELALLPDLTVTENIYAGNTLRRRGSLDRAAMDRGAAAALVRLGAHIDHRRRVDGMSTADQQFVELARGLVRSSRVLILDEPTAALPPRDVQRLLRVLRELAADGVGIAYVSHRLDEVLDVADDITVLKDGKVVTTRSAAAMTAPAIISLMVGRPLADLFPPRTERQPGESVLTVRGLIAPPAIRGVDLDIGDGEIVGLYGLEGAGQDEVLGCLAGDVRRTDGTIAVKGKRVRGRGVAAAMRQGFGFMPPDRKQQGLLLDASAIRNVSLPVLRQRFAPNLFVRAGDEATQCTATAREAAVRGELANPVGALSGGNQQKILMARLLMARSAVLLLNQPTRGVDVGAKAEIYRLIRSMVGDGRGAVVASPEIVELIGLCDRIVVIRQGRVAGEVSAAAATEESVLTMAVP